MPTITPSQQITRLTTNYGPTPNPEATLNNLKKETTHRRKAPLSSLVNQNLCPYPTLQTHPTISFRTPDRKNDHPNTTIPFRLSRVITHIMQKAAPDRLLKLLSYSYHRYSGLPGGLFWRITTEPSPNYVTTVLHLHQTRDKTRLNCSLYIQ